ncbi:MAG TPA: hypothetical protein VIV11_34850 [Kofleriaceae bacterium]
MFAACGDDGGGGTSTHKDAAVDSPRPIDAAVDAPLDAPKVYMDAMWPMAHHHYVLDRVLLPNTNTQARAYGLDLNGDMTVDNQLGMVFSTLAGMGFDNQTPMTQAIDKGTAIMLADINADALSTAPFAAFTIYQGANPMPPACSSPSDIVCRKHLTGSGSFSLKANAPVDPALQGSISGTGTLVAGPGHLTIQVSMLGSVPATVTLIGARVELMPTATSFMGKLGGGVSMSDINTKVLPAMRDGVAIAVARDCTMLMSPPACGCAADTTGKTMLGLFDTTPKDCMVTLAEIQNNSLIQALFAPDVTLENQMALSLGVSVGAVKGMFTAPM